MTHPNTEPPLPQDVDFLPAEYHVARDRTRKRVWRRALLAVFLGLIVAGALQQRSSHVALRNRTADLERRAGEAERQVPDADRLRARIASLSNRSHLWLRLRVQPRASRLLLAVADARPKRVSLSAVTVAFESVGEERPRAGRSRSRDEAGGAESDPVKADLENLLTLHRGRQRVLRVEGHAASDVLVSEYLRRLETLGLFEEVRLLVTESARFREHPLRRFSLRLVVREPRPFEPEAVGRSSIAHLSPAKGRTR